MLNITFIILIIGISLTVIGLASIGMIIASRKNILENIFLTISTIGAILIIVALLVSLL